MALPAPQLPRAVEAPSTPDRFGAVAAGGPIAEMQRTLEQRLLGAEVLMDQPEGGAAHRFSRLAGPALLASTYVAVALWWF